LLGWAHLNIANVVRIRINFFMRFLHGCFITFMTALMMCVVQAEPVEIRSDSDIKVSQRVLSQGKAPILDFDIPPQALEGALKLYGRITLQPTLFRSEMLVGKQSFALHGSYTPEEAIVHLLSGTGLEAERIHTEAGSMWVLKQQEKEQSVYLAILALEGYPGVLQSLVRKTLCRDEITKPGTYRMLLRLYVAENGDVQQVRLLGSTGNVKRDKAIQQVLEAIHIGSAPPPDMPQPVTLLILPENANSENTCQHVMRHFGE
jgi:hypothetical protein